MNTSDLKLELIKAIIDSNDINLLLKIKTLFVEKNYSGSDENSATVNEPSVEYKNLKAQNIRIFSDAEQKKIDQALKEYENGECISDEEAQKEIKAWLED